MSCQYRERRGDSRGCRFWDAGYCTSDTAKYYRCIDWIASTKLEKIIVSHSQITSWERCPFKWYLEQIEGLQMVDQLRPLPMRMGSELQRLLSGIGMPEHFGEREQIHKSIVNMMYGIIMQRELLPHPAEWEVALDKNGMSGFVDLVFDEGRSLGEIKFGASPDFYLNNPIAKNQLERYCYMNQSFQRSYMLPIRNPMLRDKMDEEIEGKIARTQADILRRMNHYFPQYEPTQTPPKWGRAYRANEFDLVAFKYKLDWIKREIQMSCKEGYFVQKTANCFSPGKCSFISIYETGNINWNLFERRTR